MRLLTSGCNTAIEHLSSYIGPISALLTEQTPCQIKDIAHLLNIIGDLNKDYISDNCILVSFAIVNMYPNIDNVRGFAAIASFLNMHETKLPSTECLIEGLKVCLCHNNSIFIGVNLLQSAGTATGAPNLCSYGDIAVASIDNEVLDQKATCFDDLVYFERYKDDCFLLWKGTVEKLESFLE